MADVARDIDISNTKSLADYLGVPEAELLDVSKKGRKRLLKRKLTEGRWEAKKRAKKARQKEAKAAMRAARAAHLANNPEVAAAAAAHGRGQGLPRSEEERVQMRSARAKREAARSAQYASGPRVVIDCSFESKMTKKELKSFVQQLMYCYGLNRRAKRPFRMCLSSLGGETEAALRRIGGFDSWPLFPSARPYDNDPELSNDPKGEIVYLSAEADEVMDEFDPSKAYVIGGIVDRNRHKGLTDRKAQAQGIKRVRLPIGEYLRMRSTKVLTVNHVFEILLKMYEHGDWKTALQAVMPERKVAKDGQK